MDVPLRFSRSDPRFANVISRPDGRLGMVDWEDSGLHAPALDLADLMEHPNQEDLLKPEEWKVFLKPYLEVQSRTDPNLSHRSHLYRGLLPVWWLSILVDAGIRRFETGNFAQWRIHDSEPNMKLRRYLARARMWPEVDLPPKYSLMDSHSFFPV